MSRIRADKLVNKNASGGPDLPLGATISGVVTATTFSGGFTGSGANLTDVPASSLIGTPDIAVGNVNSTGIATFTTGNFTGNVSIGGTLTYDDVTNIDSVGLITARNGINVIAGISTFGAGAKVTGSYTSNITAMGANDVDCSAGNYFTKTITGATTFTFSNVPASTAYIMTIEVTLNGSNAITWPAAVKWPADTPPTLTDGKTQLFTFVTDDGGTRWRANSSVDYVN